MHTRIHSLDNLRALAMLAGVLFHAALAYSPLMHAYWLTADAGQWAGVDVVVWFLHLFRMPLFFAIAGYFAARQVAVRGVGGLMRNRAARVLLPLVIFWPLVTGSLGWLAEWAAASVQQVSPVLALIRSGALPALPPSLAHLWFLYYLMLFYLLVWVASVLELKVPTRWSGPWLRRWGWGVGPLVLVPALISVPAPTPAPESLLPQLWALVYYGLFFGAGYGLFARPGWLAGLRPQAPGLAVAALAAYGAFLWVLDQRSPDLGLHALAAGLQACVSVWMTLCCLVAGEAWLNTRVGWLRYLSAASYWTYLVHLPVLFALQLVLLNIDLVWPAKWALSVALTLALCLASYHLAVRHTLVGQLLNGKPRAPETSTAPVPAPGPVP